NNTGSSTPLDGTSEVVTAPSGADTMRVSVLLSSPTVGDWADVSYVGIYEVGHALQSCATPVDGDTVTHGVHNPDGVTRAFTDDPPVRTNHVLNPSVLDTADGWTAVKSSAISRSSSTTPHSTGTIDVPRVVNPSALGPWLAALQDADKRSIGIGMYGDSCTETTGDISNPDLSDRYIERVQRLLREDTAVPGVPLAPEGVAGASAYVPVGYVHLGPVGWTFETSDPEKYPLQ